MNLSIWEAETISILNLEFTAVTFSDNKLLCYVFHFLDIRSFSLDSKFIDDNLKPFESTLTKQNIYITIRNIRYSSVVI